MALRSWWSWWIASIVRSLITLPCLSINLAVSPPSMLPFSLHKLLRRYSINYIRRSRMQEKHLIHNHFCHSFCQMQDELKTPVSFGKIQYLGHVYSEWLLLGDVDDPTLMKRKYRIWEITQGCYHMMFWIFSTWSGVWELRKGEEPKWNIVHLKLLALDLNPDYQSLSPSWIIVQQYDPGKFLNLENSFILVKGNWE